MTDRRAVSCGAKGEAALARDGQDSPFGLDEVFASVRQRQRRDQRRDQPRGHESLVDPCFVPAYARLTASLAEEADLTPTGVAVARRRLVSALANQIRVRELIGSHAIDPELHGHDAVFVLGLPGTGLHLLQRLLNQHAALNIPSLWEILSPTMDWHPWRATRPPDDPFAHALWAHMGRRDGFRPPDLGAPYGDHLLLAYAFHTPSASLEYRIPGYADWLRSQDATAAYEFHRSALSVILERVSGGTPVLVNEFHSLKLPELLTVYPTARVIRVHRDPLAALGNVAGTSMLRRRTWSRRVDPTEVTAEWARCLRSAMATPEWRGTVPIGAEVLDVAYPDLVETPLLTLRRICEFLGTPLPPSAERRALEQYGQFPGEPGEDRSAGCFPLVEAALPDDFREHRAAYCRRWGLHES